MFLLEVQRWGLRSVVIPDVGEDRVVIVACGFEVLDFDGEGQGVIALEEKV